jgi:hypothetical protein
MRPLVISKLLDKQLDPTVALISTANGGDPLEVRPTSLVRRYAYRGQAGDNGSWVLSPDIKDGTLPAL